jgi:type VI protein secretion system component VasA
MALNPRQRDDESLSIYGIEQVSGQYRSEPDSHVYRPFWQQGFGDLFHYQEQLTAHPVNDELELAVALGGELRDEQEVIKARLYCTNGGDAATLLPGQICDYTSGSPELVQFENLTTPTPYRKTLSSEQQYWQAVRQLSSNLMGHLNLERLSSALKELVLQASPDRARQQINMKKVEAIQSVSLTMGDRLVSAMSVRGYEVTLKLAGDHFPSKGDMWLFFRLLQQFFISLVPVNYFCLLKIIDVQTGETIDGSPMLGRKPLL